jgi:hypothetical protein
MTSPSTSDVLAAWLGRDATLDAVRAKVKEILESDQSEDNKHRQLYALAEHLGLTQDPSFKAEWMPREDEAQGS